MRSSHLAKRLGVAPGTVRNWSSVYGEFLTQAAKGIRPGAARVFSEQDALVLATVADLRAKGLTTGQVKQALKEGRLVEALPDLPTPEEEAARESVALVPLAELQMALSQIRIYQDEITKLEQQRDAALLAEREANVLIAELREKLGRARGQLIGIIVAAVLLAALVGAVVALLFALRGM